ncbi:MAG: divergent polysaccharide deacetylase family protein [Candidatus Omnitrophica bacterium]|nr:divergent polysaccharide deacetylase family protein [Candidatus Omnitrophota bacterium]
MKNKFLVSIAIILCLVIFIAVILIPLHKPKAPPAKITPALKGRIAIVIDDFGYNQNNLGIIEQIKQPLTCAVLPNLENTSIVAKKLHEFGFEIILHLPMEPKEAHRLEKDTVSVRMNQGEISKIIKKDLISLGYALGVSNHMGSRATQDLKTTTRIMQEIKKHDLYFLDSFVTANSVCASLAKKIGLKFAKRDVFLDNQNNPEYIKNQLGELKKIANRQGLAVGIGHDRKNTLLVLKEMLPELAREGYKFVFVSEIAR